ncbi:hypothetical protein POTOM_006382 [Populus tomentosa]|uniref:Uncharacterized protein n=1 Tax=Populus tomentosa TaxID=118781 RepID=A0A8X8DFZ5_POPTO|nr:hypothetical protein POTOM_006382 [Populus tomentosa]
MVSCSEKRLVESIMKVKEMVAHGSKMERAVWHKTIIEFQDMFVAGSETSSRTVEWAKRKCTCLSKKLLNIPPIPLLFPRESKEACKITGYDMPPQSRATVNIWGIGREPINWTEPERFYPERFLDSSMDYKGIDFKFIPFGAGILFGMVTVVLPLAQLLWF